MTPRLGHKLRKAGLAVESDHRARERDDGD